MISLPPGFDISQLVADLFALAIPFLSLAALVTVGLIILKLFRRV
jgi:uncharacterized metal-binding protein YceD (DUF177 family)